MSVKERAKTAGMESADLLTLARAAAYLEVPEFVIRNSVTDGTLRASAYFDGEIYFSRGSLDAFDDYLRLQAEHAAEAIDCFDAEARIGIADNAAMLDFITLQQK